MDPTHFLPLTPQQFHILLGLVEGACHGYGIILGVAQRTEGAISLGTGTLYTALAQTCRRFRGWRAGFLVGNPLLEEAFFPVIGAPRIKKPLANANLRAYFYLYDLG